MNQSMARIGLLALAAAAQAGAGPRIERIAPPEQGFFGKRLMVRGIAVKAHDCVADAALREASRRIGAMLSRLPEAATRMARAGVEMHIIGRDQVTSDLPDHRAWRGKPFDGVLTIDERTRGVGGLHASCGEENLLRLPGDRYAGRDICSHEFAHTLMEYGLTSEARERIRDAWRHARDAGLWPGAYSLTNEGEYFAELTMWRFGARGDPGRIEPRPQPGPAWLKGYDPEGWAALEAVYAPERRRSSPHAPEAIDTPGRRR
jgi:hypothetical protein